ncbi:MAG: hypothetical protein HY954_03485 [Deltaproteobacteria bacterium]|nr:hypothetical protein [Deltaproteobacteria bacterium]
MKKLLLGFILGIAVLAAFLYFGGAGYLKTFGAKTEEAGAKLEKYEKEIKDTAKEAKEVVEDTAKGAKKAVDKTTEKVKGYMPK